MADESGADSGEKTEEPSAHRIEEFRRKGEVASSKELTGILVLSASFLTLALSLVFLYETMTAYIEWLYGLDYEKVYEAAIRKKIIDKTFVVILKCVGPVFLSVFCISILANIAQFGLIFSTEVLEFKPERINPIAGVKRLFSMKSIVEALKGIFKFAIIMSIVYLFLKDDLKGLSAFFHMEYFGGFMHAKDIVVKLSFAIVAGLIVVAIGDFAYQKYSYKKKLMQTKEQAKRESKEQDGNPEVKQKIRSIQRQMATKRMVEDVKAADVIITNPTHLSIAIKYDSENMIAPAIVAKGGDNLAMKIREIAKEHDIPLVENVPLARTLYKTVKVGEGVPRSLYKAVAEVLAFVYKLKRQKKALG